MVEVTREIVMVPVSAIRPYPGNPRIHDATVAKLCEILPKVGFNVPMVLDAENMIVKGHARLAAAIRLGMTSVPVIYSTNDNETNRLDRIADNKVSEFSTWDDTLLPAEVAMLAPGDLQLVESLDLLIPAPLKPPLPPRAEGAEFITPEDERATASMPSVEYEEVVCDRCHNRMYVRL
jgi:ParB-like chromosome segregation protein Spo0J